jgi:hypothetical protein
VWNSERRTFPHGEFDDQVDSMTIALDFLVENPELAKVRQRRCPGMMINGRGIPLFAHQISALGVRYPYSGLGRQARMTRIFPSDEN